jgi:DNA-binding protein Fis
MSLIKNLLDWTKKKLESNPKLRDSNELLYYHYLKESGYDVNKPVKMFLQDMEKRKIPYLDSISRASRKIQEENPELRGLKWGKRKLKEVEVREEIIGLTQ